MLHYKQTLDFLPADEEQPLFEQFRGVFRTLHQQPEIALKEFKTADYIISSLKEWGFQEIYSGIGGTGVVAVLRGEENTSILIRADMDALPLQEDNDLTYKSRVPNMMHACGHDGHVSVLLGTAYQLMQQIKKGLRLKRGIKFCFQQGEENVGGARIMLADTATYDILNAEPKVLHCFGLHLLATYPCHQIGYHTGPFCANSDRWEIHIKGRGGHSAQPELTIDALQMAIHICNNIYQIRGRNINQSTPCTISIGKIEAGETYNIISETATIWGNARTKSSTDRTTILQTIENICSGAQLQFKGSIVEFVHIQSNKLIDNSTLLEPFVIRALGRIGPITPYDLVLGGEDFSEFANRVPSAFLTVGASPYGMEGTISHHQPEFLLNEESILTGIKVWLSILQDWLY